MRSMIPTHCSSVRFAAHEGRGLLVTEGAIELEGFLQCLVTAKIQRCDSHTLDG